MKNYLILAVLLILLLGVNFLSKARDKETLSFAESTSEVAQTSGTPTPAPDKKEITQRTYVSQTFNNCGPATLSMLYSYIGMEISQDGLGEKLRPYQNPTGDNDDKSVSLDELAADATGRGFFALHRPNGSDELLKEFIANDIPVVIRQWLHPHEDIAHYRLVRGYDDTNKTFLTDDSYLGPNINLSYDDFNERWQPFQYEYLVIVPKEKEYLVKELLGKEADPKAAWEAALNKARTEHEQDPENIYPIFNESVSQFQLKNYIAAVDIFEKVKDRLPSRMLWYQTEPIEAYLRTNNYDRVFSLTDAILNNNNRGYSELYLLRGQADLAKGDKDLAKDEFEKAVYYNIHLQAAKDALKALK